MPKHVLSLMLIGLSALIAQAQSQPLPIEVSQIQEKAMAHPDAMRENAITEIWDDPHQQLERMQITNAFRERQIALRRDTEKLFALAAELKQNVDKTSPNILSMDVIKKAQEIEKLAKSVKDKMKDAY